MRKGAGKELTKSDRKALRARNSLITERGLKMSRQVARKQILRKALAWTAAVVVVFTFAALAFWLAPASMGPGPEPCNAVYDKGGIK